MKQAICDRLNTALLDMYHNATPNYPWGLMEKYDTFTHKGEAIDIFNIEASFELSYLNEGGSCGLTPYGQMKHNADKSPEHKRLLNRKYRRDTATDKWLPILEYGKLYQWGRGGRTVAPDGLITMCGGSGFSIKQFDCDSMNNADAVKLIQAIEAFNSYIVRWNSKANLTALFEDIIREVKENLRYELKSERRITLALIKDAKAQRLATGPVCNLIRQTITAHIESIGAIKNKLLYA